MNTREELKELIEQLLGKMDEKTLRTVYRILNDLYCKQ